MVIGMDNVIAWVWIITVLFEMAAIGMLGLVCRRLVVLVREQSRMLVAMGELVHTQTMVVESAVNTLRGAPAGR